VARHRHAQSVLLETLAPPIERQRFEHFLGEQMKKILFTALAFGVLLQIGSAQKTAINVAGGFQTPESILVDGKRDEYLVTNINGDPSTMDNNGFISRVAPDGRILELKWLEGGRGVILNAPKGMTLVGDALYVADINVVRVFNRQNRRILAAVQIPGASFLNDVTSDAAGNVFVSDSGLTPDFKPSGSAAVYKIDRNNKVSLIAKGEALALPNGLLSSTEGALVVAPFGGKAVYRLALDGTQTTLFSLPGGSLDGIEFLNGAYYVSSWETSSVYKIKDGVVSVVIDQTPSPADIALDAKRGRLLIPVFNEHRLVFQPL
jgi:DNA-binding beta-propeller fold protein YncE